METISAERLEKKFFAEEELKKLIAAVGRDVLLRYDVDAYQETVTVFIGNQRWKVSVGGDSKLGLALDVLQVILWQS